MPGAPQPGFSATIWKISSRICLQIRRPPPTRFGTLDSGTLTLQGETIGGRGLTGGGWPWNLGENAGRAPVRGRNQQINLPLPSTDPSTESESCGWLCRFFHRLHVHSSQTPLAVPSYR